MISEFARNRFEPRIVEVLGRVRNEAINAGYYATEPYDSHSTDESRWSIDLQHTATDAATRAADPLTVEVSITVCESENWDGQHPGANFVCDVVSNGGRVVCEHCCFNCSSDVWVDRADAAALDARFDAFAKSMDHCAIVQAVRRFWGRERSVVTPPRIGGSAPGPVALRLIRRAGKG
jgi:hypothetical protein